MCAQVTEEDFKAARKEVAPSAMREISLEVPNASWNDVGGLDEIKARLKESVLWPQEKASELTGMGITVGPLHNLQTLLVLLYLPFKGSPATLL